MKAEKVEELLKMNPKSERGLVLEYLNFIGSVEEYGQEEIIALIISDWVLHDNCFILTTSKVIELDKDFNSQVVVKCQITITDISRAAFEGESFFSNGDLVVYLKNGTQVKLVCYGKDQLLGFEKSLIFIMGMMAQASEQAPVTAANPTVGDVVAGEPGNAHEDVVTNKLLKLKGLFDKGLISEKEYEKKKSEVLELL
jgi:hypothetical protein